MYYHYFFFVSTSSLESCKIPTFICILFFFVLFGLDCEVNTRTGLHAARYCTLLCAIKNSFYGWSLFNFLCEALGGSAYDKMVYRWLFVYFMRSSLCL